jgi:DNA-binding transcriptional MerR regulator
MRIGELARRSGVSVRMLRYYGSHGLLGATRRPSGYREFQPQDMQIVQLIRLLNAAGFTLAAIRRILPCARGQALDFAPCAEFQASLTRQVAEIDRRMAALPASRRILAGYLGTAGTSSRDDVATSDDIDLGRV